MTALLRTALCPSLSASRSKGVLPLRTVQVTASHHTSNHHNIPVVSHTRILCGNVKKKILLSKCSSSDIKIQTRYLYSYFFRKRKSPEEIRKLDNVEPHYELIYTTDTVLYVQLGLAGIQAVVASILFSAGALVCGIPLSDTINYVLHEEPLQVGVFVAVNALLCYGIFRVCRWYPLRIYYSEIEDQFVALFVGIHPLATRQLRLTPGEVKPDPPKRRVGIMLPWTNYLYTTSKQTIYLRAEAFRYPVYYNKLLGYIEDSK